MKKYFLLLMLVTAFVSKSQTVTKNDKEYDYCIMHVFGPGHHSQWKGVHIIYENMLYERRQLPEETEKALLQVIMESIKAIESRGYRLMDTDMASENGLKYQYVFRRER